jgi:hypothetical protein
MHAVLPRRLLADINTHTSPHNCNGHEPNHDKRRRTEPRTASRASLRRKSRRKARYSRAMLRPRRLCFGSMPTETRQMSLCPTAQRQGCDPDGARAYSIGAIPALRARQPASISLSSGIRRKTIARNFPNCLNNAHRRGVLHHMPNTRQHS